MISSPFLPIFMLIFFKIVLYREFVRFSTILNSYYTGDRTKWIRTKRGSPVSNKWSVQYIFLCIELKNWLLLVSQYFITTALIEMYENKTNRNSQKIHHSFLNIFFQIGTCYSRRFVSSIFCQLIFHSLLVHHRFYIELRAF